MFPATCLNKKHEPSKFKRPADLGRHYDNVHKALAEGPKEEYPCTYSKCSLRPQGPFTRKDHYRDHLRDYHKEDIGKKQKDPGTKDEKEHQLARQEWALTRLIDPRHWSCAKCLIRIYVKAHGWTCSKCNEPCEQERIEARLRLMPPEVTPQPLSTFANCTHCSGTGWIDTTGFPDWVPCPSCQQSSMGPYDTIRTDDNY